MKMLPQTITAVILLLHTTFLSVKGVAFYKHIPKKLSDCNDNSVGGCAFNKSIFRTTPLKTTIYVGKDDEIILDDKFKKLKDKQDARLKKLNYSRSWPNIKKKKKPLKSSTNFFPKGTRALKLKHLVPFMDNSTDSYIYYEKGPTKNRSEEHHLAIVEVPKGATGKIPLKNIHIVSQNISYYENSSTGQIFSKNETRRISNPSFMMTENEEPYVVIPWSGNEEKNATKKLVLPLKRHQSTKNSDKSYKKSPTIPILLAQSSNQGNTFGPPKLEDIMIKNKRKQKTSSTFLTKEPMKYFLPKEKKLPFTNIFSQGVKTVHISTVKPKHLNSAVQTLQSQLLNNLPLSPETFNEILSSKDSSKKKRKWPKLSSSILTGEYRTNNKTTKLSRNRIPQGSQTLIYRPSSLRFPNLRQLRKGTAMFPLHLPLNILTRSGRTLVKGLQEFPSWIDQTLFGTESKQNSIVTWPFASIRFPRYNSQGNIMNPHVPKRNMYKYFQKLREKFPHFNFLRIPKGWHNYEKENLNYFPNSLYSDNHQNNDHRSTFNSQSKMAVSNTFVREDAQSPPKIPKSNSGSLILISKYENAPSESRTRSTINHIIRKHKHFKTKDEKDFQVIPPQSNPARVRSDTNESDEYKGPQLVMFTLEDAIPLVPAYPIMKSRKNPKPTSKMEGAATSNFYSPIFKKPIWKMKSNPKVYFNINNKTIIPKVKNNVIRNNSSLVQNHKDADSKKSNDLLMPSESTDIKINNNVVQEIYKDHQVDSQNDYIHDFITSTDATHAFDDSGTILNQPNLDARYMFFNDRHNKEFPPDDFHNIQYDHEKGKIVNSQHRNDQTILENDEDNRFDQKRENNYALPEIKYKTRNTNLNFNYNWLPHLNSKNRSEAETNPNASYNQRVHSNNITKWSKPRRFYNLFKNNLNSKNSFSNTRFFSNHQDSQINQKAKYSTGLFSGSDQSVLTWPKFIRPANEIGNKKLQYSINSSVNDIIRNNSKGNSQTTFITKLKPAIELSITSDNENNKSIPPGQNADILLSMKGNSKNKQQLGEQSMQIHEQNTSKNMKTQRGPTKVIRMTKKVPLTSTPQEEETGVKIKGSSPFRNSNRRFSTLRSRLNSSSKPSQKMLSLESQVLQTQNHKLKKQETNNSEQLNPLFKTKATKTMTQHFDKGKSIEGMVRKPIKSTLLQDKTKDFVFFKWNPIRINTNDNKTNSKTTKPKNLIKETEASNRSLEENISSKQNQYHGNSEDSFHKSQHVMQYLNNHKKGYNSVLKTNSYSNVQINS